MKLPLCEIAAKEKQGVEIEFSGAAQRGRLRRDFQRETPRHIETGAALRFKKVLRGKIRVADSIGIISETQVAVSGKAVLQALLVE